MRNLIYVNMMRLKKSRIFRAGVAVSMAYVAFLLFMNYQEMTDSPETVIGQLNWYFLSTLPVASAFCSVFCGMFLGTEYSDGTMRNKLMVGHTRRGDFTLTNLSYRFFWQMPLFTLQAALSQPLWGPRCSAGIWQTPCSLLSVCSAAS